MDRTPIKTRYFSVSTSQRLASDVGLHILETGGNAIDAAIAMAASLTVVEPTGCGIGSDVFAIVWDGENLHGLNGAGRAPMALPQIADVTDLPLRGWWPATTPSAPKAWAALWKRFGRLPFDTLLEPAIHLARAGFQLTPVIAQSWATSKHWLKVLDSDLYAPFAQTFFAKEFSPVTGAFFRNPDLAIALERLADSKGEDLYTGRLAEKLLKFSVSTGGFFSREDLRNHRVEWEAPLRVNFRECQVAEMPPPTQGIITSSALHMIDKTPAFTDSATRIHTSIEALKAAFSHWLPRIGDGSSPRQLARDFIAQGHVLPFRSSSHGLASSGPTDRRLEGGTVYLATADAEGRMVSLIQSNFMGFGSYVCIPDTGITLNNRGWCFNVEPDHPNSAHGGKQPFNTIIPGFLLDRRGSALGAFGVMGGLMQAQGHLQILTNLFDEFLDPQAALDAARWRFDGAKTVRHESGLPPQIVAKLKGRGHDLRVCTHASPFGRGQIILREGINMGYSAGSDSRADGCALGI